MSETSTLPTPAPTAAPSRRQHVYDDGLWSMQIEVPYPKAIRCGEMIVTCGQCDLDAAGKPNHPGDLMRQTERTMALAYEVVARAGATPGDMARLHVFYVSDGGLDEDAYLRHLADTVRRAGGGHPVVTATPIPYFYYPGMMVEVDAIAMAGHGARPRVEANDRPAWLPAPFSPALRAGETIWIGTLLPRAADGAVIAAGQAGKQTEHLLDQLAERLAAFGADLADVVKLHTVYAPAPGAWAEIAHARARRFGDPATAPAAVDVPVPHLSPAGVAVRMEAIALRGMDGRRVKRTALHAPGAGRPPVAWPFPGAVKCADKLFIGAQWPFGADGQVMDPDDGEAQTRQAMNAMGDLLALAGMTFRHVVKATTHYRGGPTPEDLHANMGVRNRYYTRPGPASTGIPLPTFEARGQTLVLDAFAMAD